MHGIIPNVFDYWLFFDKPKHTQKCVTYAIFMHCIAFLNGLFGKIYITQRNSAENC